MTGRRSWRRGLPLVPVIALLALTAASASAATVTISGTVRCPTGAKVVGVWVQSSGGASRFADRWIFPANSSINGYKAAVNSGTIELHVGCGGEKTSWASDQYTSGIPVSASRNLNATCTGPAGTFAKRTCAYPAHPKLPVVDINGFTKGQCTWYAANKWRSATTNSYPTWDGNAMYWNERANGQGWTVAKVPAPRSVVVFEPGVHGVSSVGHVAWVNSVSYRPDGWYVNITEMNRYVPFEKTTRDVRHTTGMSYIWAPK